jgi:phosphopantothenoylcysteine decarboxylase/phosphopantothenate--cysteine ligase
MTGALAGRRIVLGVGGSIAAYKSVEILRALQQEGANVRVAMTAAATQFVTPLAFEALTRHAVMTDVMSLGHDRTIDHVEWGHWCELLLVAPATANVLAQLAAGTSQDALTALALCLRERRMVLCPAMEPHMWLHPLTRRNLHTLTDLVNAQVVEPEDGPLASGRSGVGRLASLDRVVAAAGKALQPQDYAGIRVLVTAGPTREPLDPVRFITNGSSGRMGVALVEAARARGAAVVLVHGPLQVPQPFGVRLRPVTTAQEMLAALEEELPHADVLIMSAAVSDWRPKHVAGHKVKKGAAEQALTLVANPDLLLATRHVNARCVRVGFAAETQDLQRNAREKLVRKGLQLVVANDVSAPGSGFGTDTNRVLLLDADGEVELPLMSKARVADAILSRVRAHIPAALPA